MKRLPVLFVALAASVSFAATPTLRKAPAPVVADAYTYRFTEPGWTLGGEAEITADYGYFSAPVALALPIKGIIGAGAWRRLFRWELGKWYRVTAWVNGDAAGPEQHLLVVVYMDREARYLPVPHGSGLSLAQGWRRVDLGVMPNPGWEPEMASVECVTYREGTQDGRWLVGQIEFREVDGADAMPSPE